VLVAGAGGYVGGVLVETLKAEGWNVLALGRQPARHLAVEQVTADLTAGGPAVAAACEGADAVVHLAGENEVVAARDPAAALAATIAATQHLAGAAGTAGVKRFVYLSTIHVYGARMTEGAVLTEDLRPEPRSPYAIARLASEYVAASLAAPRFEVIVLRLTNSLGAPVNATVGRWKLVANDLCRQGALTGRLELRSPGVQWRDFVPLRDVCSILEAACRTQEPILPPGTYNVGSGRPMTVRELAALVQDAFERRTGARPELQAPDPGPSRPKPYHVSVERLAGRGLRAETPIATAVEETVDFCLEHREILGR
jgi:UDP-glucose 4-epimerase